MTRGLGRVRRMALEPLVDGLVGDAEVGVPGQRGHDPGDANVAHPAAELGVPPRGHPPVAWVRPGFGSGGQPPMDKGGVRTLDGDTIRMKLMNATREIAAGDHANRL